MGNLPLDRQVPNRYPRPRELIMVAYWSIGIQVGRSHRYLKL